MRKRQAKIKEIIGLDERDITYVRTSMY